MGAWINMGNHIWIGKESIQSRYLDRMSYEEIDAEFLRDLAGKPEITRIQIDEALPMEAYSRIDQILEIRPDMYFRIYGLYEERYFDLSFLRSMTHLHHLSLDYIHMRDKQDMMDFSVLEDLDLISLTVDCFDLRDYSFIQNLSPGLEKLCIVADTMGPGIRFDCEWLLKYKNLQSLSLTQKAKKHLECVAQLPSLKSLSLRGIKITDFSFLKQMHLEELALLWNSNNDLHELADLTGLKEIGLCRINKLSDISFLEELTSLEIITLQDLKHVKELPDLSRLTNIKALYLIDTGINMNTIPEELVEKVHRWDDR